MKSKQLFLILVFVFVFAALTAGAVGQVQAAHVPTHPPMCYPINFTDEGYYGVFCLDSGNDIQAVKVDTNQPYHLIWDNTYAELIVEVEAGAYVSWCVCDMAAACIEGGFNPDPVVDLDRESLVPQPYSVTFDRGN